MTVMIWHNGDIRENADAVFNIQDRVRLGDGVFDTVLVVDGIPAYLDDHLSRLHRHLSVLGIDADLATEHVINFTKASKGRQALNIVITRGLSERGLKTPQHNAPSIVMAISTLPDSFPPVRAIIATSTRRNEHSPLSQIKSLNYGDHILAMREAEAQNSNEALLLNTRGAVTCFCAGNVFAKIDGQFITPPLLDGVMDGVMRAVIIERLGVTESSISPNDIHRAESLYMSNSIRGIVPVVELDGRVIHSPDLNLNKTILTP
jgi:branched-chain amino acid aminotransferase